MHVRAPTTHAAIGDAWKISLAADARGEPAVERVIPNIQFGKEGRINRGDEVDGIVRDIDDVFIRANTVEWRRLVIRQFGTLDLQTETRVGKSNHCALPFPPFQNGKIPGGPIFDLSRVGVILIAQTQEHQMAAMT